MKNNEWLVAQSFERAHEVVSAINTLSIRAKLTRAGVDDASRDEEVHKAREILLTFLDRFQAILQNAEAHREGTILGSDPRFGQLAKKYLSGKRQWPQLTALYSFSITEARELLASKRSEDLEKLSSFLRDLRSLMEQHAHPDILGMLGDV